MHSGGSGGAAFSLELSVGEMGKSIMVFGRKKKLEQQKAGSASRILEAEDHRMS